MAKVIIPNLSFVNLLKNKNQIVIIDANLIIPPDRTSLNVKNSSKLRLEFKKYSKEFLDPLLKVFSKIAIHEAVYEELAESDEIIAYITQKVTDGEIILLKDEGLTQEEEILRNTVEGSIAQFTNYSPEIDNRSDRGEVKSLSYAVAKDLIYFSTNDSNALSLIERRELQVYLHSLGAIKVYELIYALRVYHGNSKMFKGLYKLLYYLTASEKHINYDWATFCDICEKEYAIYIK